MCHSHVHLCLFKYICICLDGYTHICRIYVRDQWLVCTFISSFYSSLLQKYIQKCIEYKNVQNTFRITDLSFCREQLLTRVKGAKGVGMTLVQESMCPLHAVASRRYLRKPARPYFYKIHQIFQKNAYFFNRYIIHYLIQCEI